MRCAGYFRLVLCIILVVQFLVFCYADECVDSGGVANGTSLSIIYPQNNSNVSLLNVGNFNFIVRSDFYGTPITTTCPGYESNCSLELVVYANLLNDDGSVLQDAVEFFTEYTPETSSGEKTYSFESACKNSSSCIDGKYSVEASIIYGCSIRPAERMDSSLFTLHLQSPNIVRSYPENGMSVVAYDAGKARINPIFIVNDSANITNKRINTGSATIDLLSNPNYIISLDPGQYSWNFSASDSFGNTNNTIVNFTVTAYMPPINPINQSFNYSIGTPSNGQNISSEQFLINLTASDASSVKEVSVFIYNSSGLVKTLNDSNKKSVYSFIITDLPSGNYYFNASLMNDSNFIFGLQNINILLSVPAAIPTVGFIIPPRVSYLFPKNNSFTNSSNIDFRIKLNKKSKINFSFDGQTSISMNRQNDSLTFNQLFKNLTEGVHRLNLKLLTEDESTITRNISLIFTVDITPPTIDTNMSSMKYTTRNDVLISFSAKDSSGIAKKWYNYGEGNINYSTATTKALTPGNYSFKLYAQDKAGNIQTKVVSVLVSDSTNSFLTIVIIIVSTIVLIVIIIIVYSVFRKRRLSSDPNASFTTNNYGNYQASSSGNI